ncbi:MAG: hypothetical protein LAN84_07985 [Acidobacteriia bacterium]|nr:hypothetical protein [Terriglobia bacterium]
MRRNSQDGLPSPRRVLLAAGGLLCCAAAVALARVPAAPPADEPPNDAVGVIDGNSIAVQGPLTVKVAGAEVRTILLSGGDVRVKSGSARVDLSEGGHLIICGPAHFSVLKSGGALTVALDSGTIHARIEGEPALTIYTPQIQARPVAIGGDAQDLLLGLDAAGAMCVRANSGAVRIEQQLTGQSVLLPQGANVQLRNGQIDSLQTGGGRCSCELQTGPPEISRLASADEVRAAKPPAEKTAAKEEPVYQVFMPPLAFNASAAVQPEPDPRLILLVRRVRVRPTLIFQGRVEGEAVASAAAALPPAAAPPAPRKPAAGDSVVDRVRTLLHRIWPRSS